MYRINLDVINKIICIELSGSISLNEINTYLAEIKDLVNKFERGRYSMLILAQRLDPFAQNCLPVVQQITEIILNWAHKIAVVNGNRTLTKMQLRRTETEARKKVSSDTPIMRFQVINEAMNYLK